MVPVGETPATQREMGPSSILRGFVSFFAFFLAIAVELPNFMAIACLAQLLVAARGARKELLVFYRSHRLLLRPIWPEDTQALFAGIADEGVVRNLARAPWPYEERHARDFAERPVDPFFPRFLITRARDAAVVGGVGIDAVTGAPGVVEMGYWIARPHWGQGYATEAGAAVLAIAHTLGHREVRAGHFLDNPASGRVLRKLGFEPTGRVEERFSCGRGESAPTLEYAITLADGAGVHQRAA